MIYIKHDIILNYKFPSKFEHIEHVNQIESYKNQTN